MADELPAGSLSLEEGTEIVGTEQPEPVIEATDAEPEPEGTITIPQGKVVPLGAVQAERGKRKEAEKQLTALQAELAAIKPKAERYDESAVYLEKAKPIIEAIRARPDLVEQAKNPPPRVEPKGPLSEQEAIEYAKDFDLYKTDGTPDVDRAQRIAKRHADMSERTSQMAIRPFQEASAQQTSLQYKNYLLGLKDAGGNAMVDPKFLNQVWNNVPPEMSAKPEVANLLYTTALGLQAQAGVTPRTVSTPPVVTESVGGGSKGAEPLSKAGEAFYRSSNMSRKEYEATRATYKEGQHNSLE